MSTISYKAKAAAIRHLTEIMRYKVGENENNGVDVLDACAVVNTWSATDGAIFPIFVNHENAYDSAPYPYSDDDKIEIRWCDLFADAVAGANVETTLLEWKIANPSKIILCANVREELYTRTMDVVFFYADSASEYDATDLTGALKETQDAWYERRMDEIRKRVANK